MTAIRVMIVDDHPVVRQGVRSLLSSYADMEIVAEADTAQAALDTAPAARPDVIVLDIRMPGATGVASLPLLRQRCPGARVLMLTSFDDDEYIAGALRAGARGYLLKGASDETLVSAVRAVYRGESVLSGPVMNRMVTQFAGPSRDRPLPDGAGGADLGDEERQILARLVAGLSNPRIAGELYLSETTVKRKLQDIFEKLGVSTRAQAAAEAVRRGLV